MKTLKSILDAVCKVRNCTEEEIRDKKPGGMEVKLSRHLYCYIARKEFYSLKLIGKFIGRGHSAVWHSNDLINSQIETYPYIEKELKQIEKELEIDFTRNGKS